MFPPPDKDKFAQIVSDTLHQLGIADDIEYDREDFKLSFGESKKSWLDPSATVYDKRPYSPSAAFYGLGSPSGVDLERLARF